jgi:hypothetical protein
MLQELRLQLLIESKIKVTIEKLLLRSGEMKAKIGYLKNRQGLN